LCNKILASDSLDSSMSSFHSNSEFGINSNDRFNTLHFIPRSVSLLDAANHILTLFGCRLAAFAKIYFARSNVSNLAHSIHNSSLFEHVYSPYANILRAAYNFPSSSSTLAAEIQPNEDCGSD